jgi:vancomycin resistance protein VanJ
MLQNKILFSKFPYLCMNLFFASSLSILACSISIWSEWLSFIQYPLLFLPRYWVFLLLIPVLLIANKINRKQVLLIGVTSALLTAYFLNFQLPNKSLPAFSDHNNVRVMSVNLGSVLEDITETKAQIKKEKPEIIAFQETPEKLAMTIIPEGWYLRCRPSVYSRTCVASIYPLELDTTVNESAFDKVAGVYKLNIKGEEITILNIHLETPRKAFTNFNISKLNFSAVFQNVNLRYNDASAVSVWIDQNSPDIIFGDFNMPVESAIYRSQFSNYANAFNEAGIGFGYTKFTSFHGVRIDHILLGKHTSVAKSWIGNDVGSDHRPILADLLLNFSKT